ncbi:MAG: hypothetical protein ACREBG_06255 [Pyrinomonadaceae bacterium]
MKDLAMLLYLFLLFLLWPFFYLYAEARRQYSLRNRGYWARRVGRDSVRYEEKRGRSIEHVTIDGEMMAVGPHVIYVPTDEEWKKSAPEWAHSRKNEIHERVKGILGEKNYEYDYSRSDA